MIHFAEPLPLQGGAVLSGYDVVIETYGQLNADKSNAVLVCHALNASHHITGPNPDDSEGIGWWEIIWFGLVSQLIPIISLILG